MDKLTLDDVHQMYVDSVVLYEGKLVYVMGADYNARVEIYVAVERLEDGKRSDVVFDRSLFKAPNRIGYVNYENAAWFISRTPGRMFKIGLTQANIKTIATDAFIIRRAPRVNSKELQAAHDNIYPTLYKAWLAVKGEDAKCMAFDHQFAICNQRFIYFKGKRVGEIPKGNVRKSNIVWNNKFEFLADILEPDYEKTVRTFG